MQKILLVSCLGLLFGCQNLPSQTSSNASVAQASQDPTECPKKPLSEFALSNVKEINLTEETPISEPGKVKKGKSVGLTFKAEAGQKFNYTTDQDICIWVFAPDNELVDGTELPKDGNYTVEISVLQGSTTYDLEMRLESPEIIQSNQIQTDSENSTVSKVFLSEDFPQFSCGDAKPSDRNVYPVKFYPVNVPYSEANLGITQANFCQDAYQKRSKDTGEKVVQVASFLSQNKARDFANFIESQISGASVGSPTIVYE